jgi:hypothetical protein
MAEYDDDQAGKILRPPVAELESPCGGAPAEGEGEPDRERGQGVRAVVECVGEEGDRP